MTGALKLVVDPDSPLPAYDCRGETKQDNKYQAPRYVFRQIQTDDPVFLLNQQGE